MAKPYVATAVKDANETDEIILFAAATGNGNVLCGRCLHEYDEAPTRAKAKAIADAFLKKGATFELNVPTDLKLLPDNKEFAADLDRVCTLLDNLAKAKTDAERLTVIDWVVGTKGFDRPSELFKAFKAHAAKDAAGGEISQYNSWKLKPEPVKAFRAGKFSDQEKSFFKTFELVRLALEKAGFDVKKFKKV